MEIGEKHNNQNLKNTITKFKSSLDGFKDLVEKAEERVNDLESRSIKINDLKILNDLK